MTKNIIVAALAILLLGSCKKENTTSVNFNLAGKWIYKESGYSIGGPIIWTAVTPADNFIEFKEGGTFIPASNFLAGTNRYERLDSVTLQFSPASTPTGYIKMGYVIDSATGKLSMWPVSPMCIEGCGNRFVRKNN